MKIDDSSQAGWSDDYEILIRYEVLTPKQYVELHGTENLNLKK